MERFGPYSKGEIEESGLDVKVWSKSLTDIKDKKVKIHSLVKFVFFFLVQLMISQANNFAVPDCQQNTVLEDSSAYSSIRI